MKIQGDILTTDNGDLIFSDGDFAVGNATLLHTRDLIRSQKGEYKEFPTIGAGIENFCDDESPEDMLRTVRKELISDTQKVNKIQYSETTGKLIIDSWYE